MENLKARFEQLKQREQMLLIELDEIRVLLTAYENTLNEKTE